MTILLCIFLILPMTVLASAVTDIYSYSIPNQFSVILIISFFIFAYFNPAFDSSVIVKHCGAGLLILILGFILFCYNTLGGGDVKILASSALWIGLYDLSLYIMFVTLIGGGLSLTLYLWRKTPALAFYKKSKLLSSLYFGYSNEEMAIAPRTSIPYAVAIFAGLCLTLPHSFVYGTIF